MDFRIANHTDRREVEQLWAYCFEPAEHPFFQWYFANWQPANTLCGFEQGRMNTCVHLNPYTLELRGRQLPVPYIVGLATAPEARRGGVAGKLLTASLAEMRRRKCYFNILMPSKAGFYYPYGWELCYHQLKYHITLDDLRGLTGSEGEFVMVTDKKDWHQLAAVYDRFTASRHGYAIRGQEEWERLLASHQAENGYIALLIQAGQPMGYLLYTIRDAVFTVGDQAYTSWQAQRSLLNFAYNHRSQVTHAVWNSPFDDTLHFALPNPKQGVSVQPFMAGRIVDVAGALSGIDYPLAIEDRLTINVTDGLADWNNGSFALTVKGGKADVSADTSGSPDITCTIGALSLLVFGRLSAAELKQSGRLTASSAEGLALLDKCFPKCENYINEYF